MKKQEEGVPPTGGESMGTVATQYQLLIAMGEGRTQGCQNFCKKRCIYLF